MSGTERAASLREGVSARDPVAWSDELGIFADEETGPAYFIDVASRDSALRQIRRHVAAPTPIILDAGCSSGRMLQVLQSRLPAAHVAGSEVVWRSLTRAAAHVPGVCLLQADVRAIPLRDSSVDAVLLLNVLEHLADDSTAVRQVFRALKPAGVIVLEVPAGPRLFDVYDQFLRHHRRYTMLRVVDLLSRAGFVIAERSHLGFFAYPAFAVVKRRNRRFLRDRESARQAVVASAIRRTRGVSLLRAVAALEGLIGRWVSFPWGIRCIATGVKPRQYTEVGPAHSAGGQTASSIASNIAFFREEGSNYRDLIQRLDSYAAIRQSTNEALRGIRRLLDIGSGGTFDYDTSIPARIIALDLFFDPTAAPAGLPPNVTVRRGSALSIPEADATYDGALLAMLLHHLVGDTVEQSLRNVDLAISEALRVVEPGGKLVVVESCVPAWFYRFERLVFRMASRLVQRFLAHPPALQYPARLIAELAWKQGCTVEATPIRKGRWILQFGFVFPAFLTPAQAYRIVIRKPADAAQASASGGVGTA